MALLKNPDLIALMKEVTLVSIDTADVCNVCMTNNDVTSMTLSCGHKFHETCLLKSFRYHLYKKECPYCRTEVFMDHYKSTCQHVLARGPNKGTMCGKTCYADAKLCSTHCKQVMKKKQKKEQKKKQQKVTK